jgi:hypothetical protein
MTGPWQEIGELIDTLDAATTTGCRPWPGALPAQRRRAWPGASVAPGPVWWPTTAAATWRPRPWPPTESPWPSSNGWSSPRPVGRFYPTELAGREAGSGTRIQCGQAIGQVASQRVSTPVCSPFESRLMGMLAVAGGHVVPGQPVAWLRVRSGASSAG